LKTRPIYTFEKLAKSTDAMGLITRSIDALEVLARSKDAMEITRPLGVSELLDRCTDAREM